MHQLAAEFGGAPSLTTLALRSPRVLVAYCLGQAYISFFRLEGPCAPGRPNHLSIAATHTLQPPPVHPAR